METFAVVMLLGIAFCVSMAAREHRAYTALLNRTGCEYGVIRWEGEPNRHYADRIRERIAVNGGKSWR